jgi:hypothetical protein
LFLGGDYGFLSKALGISASGIHFCIYCEFDRNDRKNDKFSILNHIKCCVKRDEKVGNWKVGEKGVKYTPLIDFIPLSRILPCSLHLFCAIFGRLLLLLGFAALQNAENLDKINAWFEDRNLKITINDVTGLRVKVP